MIDGNESHCTCIKHHANNNTAIGILIFNNFLCIYGIENHPPVIWFHINSEQNEIKVKIICYTNRNENSCLDI